MGEEKGLTIKITPVTIAFALYIVTFIAGTVLMTLFTDTDVVFSVILLILTTIIAVSISKLNYACLLAGAIIMLLIGAFAKQIIATVIVLALYFISLYVLHVINRFGLNLKFKDK